MIKNEIGYPNQQHKNRLKTIYSAQNNFIVIWREEKIKEL